ncbi:type II toxin-antitoxin system HicA family toxin [Salinisphaera sp. T5B8]|uniref:type II toxin-antitoxin system HicA family toxin n=1 Tax=Salinisphaera sp. T5B8 TaxID=1304154 RepID=UPI003340CE70
MDLDETRERLMASKKNFRCQDLVQLLESLGFNVRDGKRGGHKVCTHPHLPEFYSLPFNCGHGKNPEIKPSYITNVVRTLETHEDDLRRYLNERESNNE